MTKAKKLAITMTLIADLIESTSFERGSMRIHLINGLTKNEANTLNALEFQSNYDFSEGDIYLEFREW